jgi:hypothetical protein
VGGDGGQVGEYVEGVLWMREAGEGEAFFFFFFFFFFVILFFGFFGLFNMHQSIRVGRRGVFREVIIQHTVTHFVAVSEALIHSCEFFSPCTLTEVQFAVLTPPQG